MGAVTEASKAETVGRLLGEDPLVNKIKVTVVRETRDAANIFQRFESTRYRCARIHFFGHSENTVTTGSREAVESVDADAEQNLTLQKVSGCWMGGSRYHGACCHRNVSCLGVKPTTWKR
jgi:hypothetical protein